MAIIQVTFKGHIQACSARSLANGESYSILLVDDATATKLKAAGLLAHDEKTAKKDIDPKYLSKAGVEFVPFASHEKQLKTSVDKISEEESPVLPK